MFSNISLANFPPHRLLSIHPGFSVFSLLPKIMIYLFLSTVSLRSLTKYSYASYIVALLPVLFSKSHFIPLEIFHNFRKAAVYLLTALTDSITSSCPLTLSLIFSTCWYTFSRFASSVSSSGLKIPIRIFLYFISHLSCSQVEQQLSYPF